MESGKKIRVTQVRSACGRTQKVKDTLCALGLGRIGKKRAHSVNPALWGMLYKVKHLVKVTTEE